MLANQYLEESIHSGCGQPSFESFDPDGPIYSAQDSKCRACAVLEEARERPEGAEIEKGLQFSLHVHRGTSASNRAAPNMAALLGET